MNYNRALAARYKGLAAFYMHKYKFTRHMWRRFNSKAIMHRRRAHAFGIRARKYWAMVIKYQAQWRKDSGLYGKDIHGSGFEKKSRKE